MALSTTVDELLRHASSFRWQVGSTPLSDPRLVVAVPAVYVLSMYSLAALLRGRTLPLGPLPALHNLVLCLWSAAMFAAAAYETLRRVANNGDASWLLCFPPSTRAEGRLFFVSYVYYVSKYYELLDTLLLVLKGRPLTTLHVFHHAIVIGMAYAWLDSVQSLQVVGLLTNTGIHVIMYSYFLASSLGAKPGKFVKKLITSSQIVQFVFSLVCSVPFLYMHVHRRGGCLGFNAWAFNCTFNIILLALFADFHSRTYAKKAKAE
jgi:GNS1/SUR4 family